MEDHPKNGTSINNLWPSEPDTTTNHGTSNQLEELETCKSGAPTLDGSRFSSMKVSNSLIGKMDWPLMLLDLRMMKVLQLVLQTVQIKRIKDGRLSILTKQLKQLPKDWTKNLVSTSTDPSIWFHNFHLTELLSVLEPTTLWSRDGERMLLNNNSSSMKFQRPSDQRHGPIMPWKSNQTEDLTILELHLVSLQDGGNCSKKKAISSWMKEERESKSKEMLTVKIEMSLLLLKNMVKLTNNGKLSMLMSIQMSQLRDNSTRNMVFMSKEISTSSHNLEQTDILI